MLQQPWEIAALYSALVTICMALAAFVCICGCKAKERKDELVGIEGHVKMTNPEVLQVSEPNGTVRGGGDVDRAATSAKRSLPDLPVDDPRAGPPTGDGDVSWEPSGDTVSELYATVGIQKSVKPDATTPSTPKEHPYDKLKGVEHPYAQVNMVESASTSQEPAVIPPSPRHSASASAPPTRDIAAAPAIAGHVHASDDLPYMTPPTHFSGDSQDSAKGYTSISVREPLATIRAETVEVRGESRGDRHYATVSDDSDDMYAAIEEPASGSETYAQIRPAPPSVDSLRAATAPPDPNSHSRQESSSSAASSGPVHSPKPEKREANSPLPAPPERNLDDMYAKVNKKRRRDVVEETLERGASTESAMTGSSESVSYRLQSNNISTTDTSSISHSCHGQSTSTTSASDPSVPSGPSTHSCASHSTTESPSSRHHEASDSSLSSDPDAQASYERLNDDPRYETLGKKSPGKRDPGYETLDRLGKRSNYETLGGVADDPCYATVRKTSDPGYETLNNGEALVESSDFDSEPNYETLGKGPPSDADPNYERIGHDYASLQCHRTDDGYATVANQGLVKVGDPQYASVDGHRYSQVMKHIGDDREGDPPYASLESHAYAQVVKRKKEVSSVEPPYASLDGEGFTSEPDYESVQYSSGHLDPPYQLLADFESGAVQQK